MNARRLALALFLAFAGLLTVDPALARSHSVAKPAATTATKPAAKTSNVPTVDNPALLVDMQTGDVLYENNAGEPWHPASLTKLMTAYIAFQAIADGRLTLDSRVVMSPQAVNQAPARSGLPAGDSLTLRDALYIMLVKSANDMAWAVAETVGNGDVAAGVAEMNATAAKLGLTRTHYDNPNGLPDDGQVTTARDLAVLAIDLRRTFPQYDDIFRTTNVTLGKVNLRASNQLLSRFAGATGMKTGFICGSGLNIVATAQRGSGHELLAVYLGGSSERERDQLTAQLLLKGFDGTYPDTGKSVVIIADDMTAPPMDMKPLLCGRNAGAYVAARLRAYPFGLRGQQNFLTDKVPPDTYAAADFGVPGKPPVVPVPQDDATAEGDAAAGDDGATDDATGAATNAAALAVAPLPRTAVKRK